MADSVSVTSHHSYGSRVGNSFKNILGGLFLLVISIILLVRNENNYVKEKNALNEGASIVQEASSTQIDSSLEGKLVHLYGDTASNAEALKDNVFGIITDDLKLKRTVEMYQWEEESIEHCTDNVGGSEDCTTTYTYNKTWSDKAINSNAFHESSTYSNPTNRRYQSTEQSKSPITLGAYTLTTTFVNQLTNYQNINLNEQNVTTPEDYTNNADGFHIQSNYIYIGKDSNSPAIGDLRISFSSVKPGTVSIIGKQLGNELTTYTVSNGRSISLLEQGNVSASDMFLHAQQANKKITWILRLFGLFLMFCAFSMMMQFIETLAKVLPFLANIVGVGTRLIAFCLTLVVGFVVIGLAWIAVRPIVGISCLVIAVAGIFLLAKSKKNKKDTEPVEGSKTNDSEPTEVIEA